MTEEVAGRLKEALGERSIRSLQQALEKKDVPGSSYPNVHAYFSGKTKPSIEFLAAVAEELGMRPAWLAFGELPMRPASNPVARGMEQAESGSGAIGLAAMSMGASEPLLQALLWRLVKAQPVGAPEPGPGAVSALVNALQQNIRQTHEALTVVSHGPASMQFVIGVLNAMLAGVSAPGEGRPIPEVTAMLWKQEDPDAS